MAEHSTRRFDQHMQQIELEARQGDESVVHVHHTLLGIEGDGIVMPHGGGTMTGGLLEQELSGSLVIETDHTMSGLFEMFEDLAFLGD